MASLLILKGTNQGQRIKLEKDQVVIGRDPDSDLVVPGNAVSRKHAQIVRVNDQFYLEDLKSRNKTYLNNQEVDPDNRLRLRDNDRIKICDFLCTYHETALPPLPPELRKDLDKPEEDEDGAASTVMSTMEVKAGGQGLLESQPAEKLKILLEITNSLTKTLQLEPLLPKILENLFLIYKQADRGFIILREEPSRKLIPKAIKTRREKDEASARFSRGIVNQCMDNAQAILSKDASTDQRFGHSQSISDFRIRSVMCAPLRGQDAKVFGVIQLDTQDKTKEFSNDDLQLLVAVSNQAAVAFENAKLHEDMLTRDRMQRELQFAKEVQLGFLPAQPPSVPGYEFFAHYEAAYDVGGDFYSFNTLPNQRVVVAIGDVAGKGVPAALLMAKLSSDVRYCLLTEPNPATAVTQLNQLLIQAGMGDRFVTLALILLDVAQHTLTLVNAGHLVPLVKRAATGIVEEVTGGDTTGLPLGVLDGYQYLSCQVVLEPGDVVVLCTDGIIDAMSPAEEFFGSERVLPTLQEGPGAPEELGRHLLKAVTQHVAGRAQNDDITLVCFGRTGTESALALEPVPTP